MPPPRRTRKESGTVRRLSPRGSRSLLPGTPRRGCRRRNRQYARLRQPLPIDRLALFVDRNNFAEVVNVLQRIGGQAHEVRELAGFDRAEVVQPARRDCAVLRGGDDRLRRRHSQLDEAFDGENRPDAVVLIDRLWRSRQLRRGRPIAVGAGLHDGAGTNERLRVAPPRLETGAHIRILFPTLRPGLLVLQAAAALFFRFGPLLFGFFTRLDMALPRRAGDGAGQHGADDAALADGLQQVGWNFTPVEHLGMLNAVDAGGKRDPQAFDARRVGLGE